MKRKPNVKSLEPTLDLFVGGSGQELHVVARDGAGNLSNFTAYNTDSSQLVTIRAGGGTFALTYSGQTTAPLPVGIPGR